MAWIHDGKLSAEEVVSRRARLTQQKDTHLGDQGPDVLTTGVIIGLGIVLLACTVLYLIPRTAVLGAILLTGYLGGAVATHVRIGHPLFSHTLFPVYLAVLLWGGLCLRDPRLRTLIPLRKKDV